MARPKVEGLEVKVRKNVMMRQSVWDLASEIGGGSASAGIETALLKMRRESDESKRQADWRHTLQRLGD